jgi:hypothetical protein
MITILPIMNSAVEEIFAFKTCCGLKLFDQNLELRITNHGSTPVRIRGYFDLAIHSETRRIGTLFPAGELPVGPGESRAFYCSMDEVIWSMAESIVFYDTDGKSYRCSVTTVHRPSATDDRHPSTDH